MKLFTDIKNQPHDSSGIDNPYNYYWQKSSNLNLFYPQQKINKTVLTDRQKEIIDNYATTGNDQHGQKVKNLFTFANSISSSVSAIKNYLT